MAFAYARQSRIILRRWRHQAQKSDPVCSVSHIEVSERPRSNKARAAHCASDLFS